MRRAGDPRQRTSEGRDRNVSRAERRAAVDDGDWNLYSMSANGSLYQGEEQMR